MPWSTSIKYKKQCKHTKLANFFTLLTILVIQYFPKSLPLSYKTSIYSALHINHIESLITKWSSQPHILKEVSWWDLKQFLWALLGLLHLLYVAGQVSHLLLEPLVALEQCLWLSINNRHLIVWWFGMVSMAIKNVNSIREICISTPAEFIPPHCVKSRD